jgi:hypothetical protein
MNRYAAEKASYHKLLDILYVGSDGSDLDCCDHIEDTPSGIIVMYNKDGSFAGAEIPLFRKKYGKLPAIIDIDTLEPFELSVDSAKSFPM